jgi:hypothetical protein
VGRNNKQRRRLKEHARKHRHPSSHAEGGGRVGDAAGSAFRRPDLGHETSAAEVGVLVHEAELAALRALDLGDRPGVEGAAARLAAVTADPARRRLAEQALLSDLQRSVTHLWRTGWQPADVARVADRRLGAPPARLVRDLMADELRCYPQDAVDPAWRAQCEASEIRVWWPSQQNALQARIPHGVAWSEQLSTAFEALHLLRTLPPLEMLTPPPGSAPSRRAPATDASRVVDERILVRVRALLAKAESTPYAAEAETFTAGAQALMARHSIDAAMVAATAPAAGEEPAGRRLGVDPPYEAAKATLFQVVAEANRCRVAWSRHFGFVTVVGFPGDLHAVETLVTSLLVQATRAMHEAGTRTTTTGRSRTRSFRQSFLMSFATRVGERLAETTRGETARAAGEDGYENLLPVLADRDTRVDTALAAMFPQLTHRSVRLGHDGEGWARGRAAADLAALAPGAALPDAR